MQITCEIITEVDGVREEVRVTVANAGTELDETVTAITEATRSSVNMLEERRRIIL